MRRIVLPGVLLVLLASACVRVAIPVPIVGPVTIGGPSPRPPEPPPRPVPCEEISRIPCDFLHCQAPGYDLVTINCAGKGVSTKCVQNGGCTKEAEKDE